MKALLIVCVVAVAIVWVMGMRELYRAYKRLR